MCESWDLELGCLPVRLSFLPQTALILQLHTATPGDSNLCLCPCKARDLTHWTTPCFLNLPFFQSPLFLMVLKCFYLPSSPLPTRGSGKERWIGQRRTWACLDTVLWGWFQSLLTGYQQLISHKYKVVALSTHKRYSQISNGSWIQKKLQDSANWPKSMEVARSQQNTPVVHFSLGSHDQQWSAKNHTVNQYHTVLLVKTSISKAQQWPAKNGKEYQYRRALSTVCWVILIPFPNIMCSLRQPRQQNITCPFSRLLPEKHGVSVLSKISFHMSALAKNFLS